jgi:hypothetical protein
MISLRFGVAKYLYATSIVMFGSRLARRPSVSSARFTDLRRADVALARRLELILEGAVFVVQQALRSA